MRTYVAAAGSVRVLGLIEACLQRQDRQGEVEGAQPGLLAVDRNDVSPAHGRKSLGVGIGEECELA